MAMHLRQYIMAVQYGSEFACAYGSALRFCIMVLHLRLRIMAVECALLLRNTMHHLTFHNSSRISIAGISANVMYIPRHNTHCITER